MEIIKEDVDLVVSPPYVSSLFPESDSVGNSISLDNILITFTKQISGSSVNSSTFVVKDSENNNISGSYSVLNDTISFNPSSNLSYNMIYTVTAKAGILDVDGNQMGNEFSWSFKTADAPSSIKPIIKYARINNGQSATKETTVSLEISATDSYGYKQNLKAHYKTSEDSEWSNWENLSDGLLTFSDIPLNVSESGQTFIFDVEVKDGSNIVSDIIQEDITYELTPPTIIDVNWDDETTYSYNKSILQITFNDEMSPESFSDSNYFIERVSDSQKLTAFINLVDSDSNNNDTANLWGLSLYPNTEYKVTLGNDVADVAGNLIGGDITEWYFTTSFADGGSAPEGTITLIDIGDTVRTLPEGVLATSGYQLQLNLAGITDDYHDVVQMKFWGDSSTGYVSEPAWESFATTKLWNVSNTSGVKILSYNFKDSYDVSYDEPRHLQILLDKTEPDNPTVTVNGGTGLFTNNSEAKVDITINTSDTYSGLYQMDINDSHRSSNWIDWSPAYDEWVLQNGDGLYTFTVSARDYVNNTSVTPGTATIVLDRADPELTIKTTNILVSEAETISEGSTGSDYYEITGEGAPFGIESYYWEQIGGLGTISFSSNSAIEPSVSASADGTYYIKVTATDYAGNQSSATIPFTWDATDPGDIGNLAVSAYDTTGQPTWTWDAVGDADFYRTSYVSNFSSYIDVYTNSFTPNTPLSPDGNKLLYVRAQDLAGNSSLELDATVHVDTTNPTISVTNSSFIANGDTPTIPIDYDAGPDGSVSDGGTNPSGFNSSSYAWSKISGSGTVNFGSPSDLETTVSATANDNYQIRLTVTDIAGNSTYSDFDLLRDITDPGMPDVSGPVITPSVRPTWFWSTGGGGIGLYKWKLDTGAWSTETTDTSYFPGIDLDGTPPGVNHILYVQEKDAAENWSAVGSWTIEIDTDAKTPPSISINDIYPSLRNVNYIT
ncbi:MAG: Ig-like domain-containing protein, partial [Bacteroidales bacterium]|nr:Ig-like domain-containing protein [Bacteroidales bacterium]